MPIRFTVEGISVEADSAAEALAMIKALSKQEPGRAAAPAPAHATAQQAGGVTPPAEPAGVNGWDPAGVQKLALRLPDSSRRAIGFLIRQGKAASTRELAGFLSMSDVRGIGSVLSGIRRAAKDVGVPDPLVISPRDPRSDGSERASQVDLTAPFRRVAGTAVGAFN